MTKKIKKKRLNNMTKEREGFVSQGINDSVIQREKFKSTNRKFSLINYLLMLFLIIFPLTAFILANTFPHLVLGDYLFNPIFFTDKSALFQTEYREVKKNSNHIIDLSYFADNRIKSDNYSTKSHFFSSSKFNLELEGFTDSSINMNLQQVSNDNYLKMYKLKSPLITNESSFHSFIEFSGSKED